MRHGEDGRRTLDALDDADSGTARRVLEAGTECTGGSCPSPREIRRFRTAVVEATESGEVSDAEVAQAVRRIDELNGQRRADAVEYVSETGRFGVEMTGKLDDEALDRLVQLDADSQRLLVQAWRSESVDVTDNNVRVLLRSDIPTILSHHPHAGLDTIGRLTTLRKQGRLSETGTKALKRASKEGDIDGDELRRVSKLLDKENEKYLYDGDVPLNKFLEYTDQIDIRNVHVVVEDSSGAVRPLLQGEYDPEYTKRNDGWEYVENRHILGRNADGKDATGLFPLGQKFKGRKLNPNREMSTKDVKKIIFNAVKNSDTDERGTIEYDVGPDLKTRTGVDRVKVIFRGGQIRQAYPKDPDLTWVSQANEWKDILMS